MPEEGGTPLRIGVECYAGYRGEETPRSLFFGDRKVEVVSVLDRWLDPQYRYFKVRGEDGGLYIIRHDQAEHRWELTLFQSGEKGGA